MLSLRDFKFLCSPLLIIGLIFWLVAHIPAVWYGSENLPLHSSYVGDEQSPIIGALHIAENKNIFTIHNLESLYYGPLFAMLAVPAVVGDFVSAGLEAGNFSAESYKNHVLYDWGGILWKTRIISLLTGFLGLVALYKILTTTTINPQGSRRLAFFGTALLATNFYYFEYSSFFKHWVFIMVPMLWQLYFLLKIQAEPERANRYFGYQALLAVFGFGVSYLSLLSQVMFVPTIIKYLKTFDVRIRNGFLVYFSICVTLGALIAAWHPYAIIRYLGIFSGDVLGVGDSQHALTSGAGQLSFGYYAELFLVNHAFLVIALGILFLFLRSFSVPVRSWLISTLLVAVAYMTVLGFFGIYVSRYALPAIIILNVVVAVVFVYSYCSLSQLLRKVVIALLCVNILFHLISVLFWLHMVLQGPPEQRVVNSILQLQAEYPSAVIATNQQKLFAWPHTVSGYTEFAAKNGKSDRPLFVGYINSQSPQVKLLDVQYGSTKGAPIDSPDTFFFDCVDPVASGEYEIDYPEIRLTRLWTTTYEWQFSCTLYQSDI